MQQSGHIQAVIDVVNEWKRQKTKPFDHILNYYFRDRRFIGSKDRQQISLYSYDVFRHKMLLEWWAEFGMKRDCLEEEENYALKIVAVLLCLVRRKSPGEVNALFSGEKYAPRELDRPERKMIETIWEQPDYGKNPLYHDSMPAHVRLNTPEWLYEKMGELNERRSDVLRAMNHPATIDFRVNTLKSDRDLVLEQLLSQKIEAIATPYSSWGIRLQKRFNLNTLDIYKQGVVELQDEGSQLLCELTDARPNYTVVDYCAGAGGKSLAFAMTMRNKGRLVLCDTADWRLNKSNDRLRRAGVFNVQDKIVLETDEGEAALSKLLGKADVVFVDAPCSGTGTWRRNPDARFRLSGKELDELVQLQKSILEKASTLVKPGGMLVYATCSILSIENKGQVDGFLHNVEGFNIEPIQFKDESIDYLQLDPYAYQTDGFFMAKLRRGA